MPVRPLGLAADRLRAGPGETLATHGDRVVQRFGCGLDQKELATLAVDDDAADGIGARERDGARLDHRNRRLVAARLQPRSVAPRSVVVVPSPEWREEIWRWPLIVAKAAAAVGRAPILSVGRPHHRQQKHRRQSYAPHGPVFPFCFRVSQSRPGLARLHIQEVTEILNGAIGKRGLPMRIYGPLRKECHVPSAPMAMRQWVYFPADRISFRAAGATRRSASTSCAGLSLSSATSAKYGHT